MDLEYSETGIILRGSDCFCQGWDSVWVKESFKDHIMSRLMEEGIKKRAVDRPSAWYQIRISIGFVGNYWEEQPSGSF